MQRFQTSVMEPMGKVRVWIVPRRVRRKKGGEPVSPGRCAAAISDTDWEGLVVGFRAQGDAGEAALEQRHESGVPITDDKEQ